MKQNQLSLTNVLVHVGLALVCALFVWFAGGHAAMAQRWACEGEMSCPNPGNTCEDGTIFAGCSTNASGQYYPLYITRCNVGESWNGSVCTGSVSWISWGSAGTARGTVSETDGEANTNTLGALGAGPHPAAYACYNLTAHGYTDWYLPSRSELFAINIHNSISLPGFEANTYWSSTEYNDARAYTSSFADLGLAGSAKGDSRHARCVRRR